MIEPLQSDDQLLADILTSALDPAAVHLWWLGQSGFLLATGGQFLLMDPYLSESLTKKYADTDRPHIRLTRRPIAPERLGFVDWVTSSHCHTDHLDGETLGPILSAGKAQLLVPLANQEFAVTRLQPWGDFRDRVLAVGSETSISAGPFQISIIPSAHETLECDEAGNPRFVGFVVASAGRRIYHSGDTVEYPGLRDRLRAFALDLALLPINGRQADRKVAGNLWGREAAELAKDAGCGLVIPCHYEMFSFNTASPREFVSTCESMGQPYRILKAGERFTV